MNEQQKRVMHEALDSLIERAEQDGLDLKVTDVDLTLSTLKVDLAGHPKCIETIETWTSELVADVNGILDVEEFNHARQVYVGGELL